MTHKLLNPGPVTLTERVRNALLRPDLCHREAEFSELLQRIGRHLKDVDPAVTDLIPLVLAGSGTSAVEAMVQSLVPRGGTALVLVNGVYGDRMVRMLKAQGKTARVIAQPWGQTLAFTPADLVGVDAILIVHHETTTGRLNDLQPIAQLAADLGLPLLVDAVSSFGAEALPRIANLQVAYAATANKCLHGVPGAAFVLADRALLAKASGACSVVLDLHQYQDATSDQPVPFTPPVHVLYALDEALLEYREMGGLVARAATYRQRSRLVRDGLRALGLEPLLADHETSVCLSAFRLPEGVAYPALHDHLKAAGFTVYAGQGHFAGEILRVATMGDLSEADLHRFLASVREYLRSLK